MQTKELVIPKEFIQQEWQTNKVKIRKWNLAIRNAILDETAKFSTTGGKAMSANIQGGYSQILIIAKCITEAPWKVGDVATIGELDPEFGDWLYGEISEFNGGVSKNPQGGVES